MRRIFCLFIILAIGGSIGAGGGAIVVAQIKKPQAQASLQLTMQKIVDRTKQGVSSDEIISKIEAPNPKYSLTSYDIGYLNKQGVSQRVIEAIRAYQ